MIDCQCTGEGYCTYYQQRLWGRNYEIAHGINCSEAEHENRRNMLVRLRDRSAAKPKAVLIAPEEPVVIAQEVSTPEAPAKPAKKGCGCGKGGKRKVS